MPRRTRRRSLRQVGLEDRLKSALGTRESATILGIYVTRVKPGRGLHVIVPSGGGGGAEEEPEYAEVWNADRCYTWIVPDARKMDLHDVRVGRRDQLQKASTTRRASSARDLVTYTPSMRLQGALRDAVHHGHGMPFADPDLRRITRNVVLNGLALVVPDGRSNSLAPIVDFYPGHHEVWSWVCGERGTGRGFERESETGVCPCVVPTAYDSVYRPTFDGSPQRESFRIPNRPPIGPTLLFSHYPANSEMSGIMRNE